AGAIRTALANGYNGSGSWNGANSISSSSAAVVFSDSANANKTALGYAAASTLGVTSFAGQSVVGSDVLVRYTYGGDANLDGKVNALDFNLLASGYGPDSQWALGDFNYDGQVNSADFAAMAVNFNAATLASPALGTLVPEPGIALSLMGGLGMLATRRRRNI